MARGKQSRASVEPAVVQEALRRHVGDAMRALRAPELTDDAIHRARKDLKAARANLRLLRAALDEDDYRRENAALRDAARPLSRARDAKVMLDTVDELVAHEDDTARLALLLKLRTSLEKAWREALSATTGSDAVHSSAAALEAAWTRIDLWQLAGARPASVRKGIKRVYRDAREALSEALEDSEADNLHEWRKQVKYLRSALQTYSPADAEGLVTLMRRTDAVAARLGLDHDLVVLQAEVSRLHSAATAARSGLFSDIAERRAKLQSKALKQGRRLFRRKPGAFVKKLPSQPT